MQNETSVNFEELTQRLKAATAEPPDLNLNVLKEALGTGWKIERLRLSECPVKGAPGLTFVLSQDQVLTEIPVSSGPELRRFLQEQSGAISLLRIDDAPIPSRIELLDVIERGELAQVVRSLWQASGLAAGIVRMPPPGHGVPQDEAEFANWRVTDVVGTSKFCRSIRQISCGNTRCMWSDVKQAREAASTGRPVMYRCHCGLLDMVAAIRVAGQPVANVYLGQARPPDLTFETVWQYYQDVLGKSSAVRVAVDPAHLKADFEELPCKLPTDMENMAGILQTMADMVSTRATATVGFRSLLDAHASIGATVSLPSGLHVLLDAVLSLVNADSGGVFLLDADRKSLVSNALRWGPTQTPVILSAWGHGIIPYVISTGGKTLHLRTREEINDLGPPQEPDSRDLRGLQSMIACPITVQDTIVGVLDVGSSRRSAFTLADVRFTQDFAREMGTYVQTSNLRMELISATAGQDFHEVCRALARHVPSLIGGHGCSVFIRQHGGGPATLEASTEFPPEAIGTLKYSEGEGLTGWVLAHGRPVRIAGGPGCRTVNLPDAYAGAKWAGKFRALDLERQPGYYEHRPWLGVPLIAHGGEVLGVIRVADKRVGDFSESDEVLVRSYASMVARLIKRQSGRRRAP